MADLVDLGDKIINVHRVFYKKDIGVPFHHQAIDAKIGPNDTDLKAFENRIWISEGIKEGVEGGWAFLFSSFSRER